MADPSLQTFCCRKTANLSESADFLLEINSNSYSYVCLISSTIGILGAILQIWPRHPKRSTHRWSSVTNSRGRHIIVWLALADLLASFGVFLRSILWLYYDFRNITASQDFITISCATIAAWIQYFYTVTWLWTMVYAIDMRQVLKGRPGHPYCYHFAVWTIPAVLTSIGLSVLYVPNANCHNLHSRASTFWRLLPNFFANYVPMAVVMLVNPILYYNLTSDMELLVSSMAGQMTNKERAFVDLIRIKFSLINVVFYVCWLPNLINGILVWTLWWHLPKDVLITLWYIMAFSNPMQALFNAIVYRKWSGNDVMYNPFYWQSSSISSSVITRRSSSSPTANESSPLIASSINCSSDSNDEKETSIFKL